jgi:N-acetylornithine carbamoyltransferase
MLSAFARFAPVPVFSLEGSSRHPLQALADALTLIERFGPEPHGKKFTLTWAPHPKPLPMAVPNSALEAAALVGMDVTIACPPGWELDADVVAGATRLAKEAGGSVRVENDQDRALDGAHVVYAKSWGALSCYGDWKAEAEKRKAHASWTVTDAKMARGRDAVLMHCLPVRRDVVVASSVLDSPRSIVVDQAENRLHTAAALLVRLLDGKVVRADSDEPEGPLYA